MVYFRCMGKTEKGAPCASGTTKRSTTGVVNVECGFKPKYICVSFGTGYNNTPSSNIVYDATRDATKQFITASAVDSFPCTSNNRLGNVTDTGFTITKTTSSTVVYGTWFAMGSEDESI